MMIGPCDRPETGRAPILPAAQLRHLMHEVPVEELLRAPFILTFVVALRKR